MGPNQQTRDRSREAATPEAPFEYHRNQELLGRDRTGDAAWRVMGKVVAIEGDRMRPSQITIDLNLSLFGRAGDLSYLYGLRLKGAVVFRPQNRPDNEFILEGEIPCTPEQGESSTWKVTLRNGVLWLM